MIRYLKTFIVAAETSSFSAAGARLGLTQSAVSTQMRRLEEELHWPLFERTGKSVALSHHGRQLLQDARRVVDLYESMRGRGHAALQGGPLTLGAVSTVQASLLPRALRLFRAAHADVAVHIVPGRSVQLLTQLDARELDMAVMIRPRLGFPAELKWTALLHEPYVAVAPLGGPQTLAALARETRFIRYDRRSHGGQLVDRFLRRHRMTVHESMELDEPAVIAQMVNEGLGWSIIPALLVPLDTLPHVTCIELPGRPLMREVGVLARQAMLRQPAAAALMESLQQAARAWSAAASTATA